MSKRYNKLLTLMLSLMMTMVFTITAAAEPAAEQTGLRKTDLAESYEGKTVVLSTNDVHGAVDGYQYVKGLKTELESRGADVIMVDAGDFSQGDIYVSTNKGAAAINLMRLAGYDYATLGNHEFDFGPVIMNENIAAAQAAEGDGTPFKILCSNILDNATNQPKYQPSDIYTKDTMGDLKVGFVGVATPETQTKSLPTNFENVHFNARNDQEVQVLYDDLDAQVAALKADGADVVFLLAHLGIDAESEPFRSSDVYEKMNNKVDMIIDGHSHTVMTAGANNEPIMSTGTKFQHIGVTVIDEETEKVESNFLYQLKLLEDLVKDNKPYQDYTTYFDDLDKDDVVGAYSQNLINTVNEEYDATFAQTSVHLNGARSLEKSGILGNRDSETNLGDLIADSMMWYVKNRVSDLGVPDENIVAITNGGGIRATIEVGNVSKRSINSVLPFGNTIAAVTVTGAELLEALEASTYNAPNESGGFPQIAGMKVQLHSYLTYDKNAEPYPGSTYYGPKTIKRVRIKEVNGKKFDPAATYVVLTNNFCSAGGDTYYAFVNASSQFDTSIPLDEALMEYIYDELKCEVGDEYANPQGRLEYLSMEEGVAALKEEIAEVEKAKKEAEEALAKEEADKEAAEAALAKAEADKKALEKRLDAIAKTVKVVTVNSATVTAKTIDAAVKKVGGSEKYVTKIVLGKKVKTVKAKALTKYKKVKTLEVKTTKLKKKAVKNSLKGSKVTTVKVSVGSKKANKKYVKVYKKIFTKRNAGKAVKVK